MSDEFPPDLSAELARAKEDSQKWMTHFYHELRVATKARERAAMWEGKFHQLRRENNALRRKLYVRETDDE